MMARLKAVPPLLWVAIAAAAGLAMLTYHRFAQDDEDTAWTQPGELQAPAVAMFPAMPGSPHVCRPADMCCAFRQRTYPGNLVDAEFSVIGGVG